MCILATTLQCTQTFNSTPRDSVERYYIELFKPEFNGVGGSVSSLSIRLYICVEGAACRDEGQRVEASVEMGVKTYSFQEKDLTVL